MPARKGPSSGRQAQVILLGLLGFLIGYLSLRFATGQTVASRKFSASPPYQVWALLVGAGTAFSGFVALPLWQWYGAMRRRFAGLHGRRALVVALCWCASIAAPIAFQASTGPKLIEPPLAHYGLRTGGLLLVYFVVALPAVLGFQLVQEAARALTESDGSSDETRIMSDYLFLQDMLRGLLAVLGGLVTVAVLRQGALVNAVNAYRVENPLPGKTNVPVPGEIIFIAASLFAAGLAVLYLPAFSALQRAGQDLVDDLCPLPKVSDDTFLAACGKRDRLKSMLGLDASAKANLESGVLILTPLIAGAISTFVRA